jgi:hypothetical protein
VARDEARAGSDIDVFVDPDPARRFGFDEFMGVYELLRERLGAELDYTTRDGLHRRLPRDREDGHTRVLMADPRTHIRLRDILDEIEGVRSITTGLTRTCRLI